MTKSKELEYKIDSEKVELHKQALKKIHNEILRKGKYCIWCGKEKDVTEIGYYVCDECHGYFDDKYVDPIYA